MSKNFVERGSVSRIRGCHGCNERSPPLTKSVPKLKGNPRKVINVEILRQQGEQHNADAVHVGLPRVH